MPTVNYTYPYSLIPTRVVEWKLEEYVTDVNISEGGVETRTLYQNEPGVNARLTLQYAASDCKAIHDLVKFWRSVQGKYRAFIIPQDHGVWMQILTPQLFRSNLVENLTEDGVSSPATDPVWRFDSVPVFKPLTDSLAAWEVTLKHLIYENI